MKTAEQKLEFLQSLKTSHIHFSDFFRTAEDVENLNDFSDVYDYLQLARAIEVEIIYYHEAMKYLAEHDTSLRLSLELAHDLGHSPESLNSEALASIYATEEHQVELFELEEEINDTFSDIEAGEYTG